MWDQITSTLLSLVFITGLGGFFGAWLQQRSWGYQKRYEKTERFRASAIEVFEIVSELMDKRLYRLEQLRVWSSRDDQSGFNVRLENYRSIVMEWNDRINHILAKLQIYMGQAIREEFDSHVGKKFVDAGAELEEAIRKRSSLDEPTDLETLLISSKVNELRSEVYEFNLKMLKEIEEL